MIISLVAALALQASPADAIVQNALHSATAQGEYITYFNTDGSYTTTIGVTGQWWVDGDQFCVQRSTGEGGCTALMEGLQLGSSWQAVNPTTGETVIYTIVPRQ